MLDTPEINLTPKTLKSPYKNTVLKVMKEKPNISEQEARNITANGLRQIRKDPITNSIFIEKRKEKLELEKTSIIDTLTGLYSRRFLEGNSNTVPPQKGILEREIERALKDVDGNVAVAMLDIDHFKNFNDTYGHQIGDDMLREAAQTVLKHIRLDLGDFAIRYGGEEFLVILPTDSDTAKKIIERIRKKISQIELKYNNEVKKITVSCGMTNLVKDKNGNASFKEIAGSMIYRADQALYQSKTKGRNQTTICVPEGEEFRYTKAY